MPTRRLQRLNEQLKREISEIVRTELRDPRVGLPTVTRVDVTPDLWLARVYVRAPGEESGAEVLAGLESAGSFVRRRLGEELHLRRIPELRFIEDRSLEAARRVDELLAEVLPDEAENDALETSDPDDPARPGES